MTASLISVVICTYNREDLLRSAAQSVCEQTLASDEFELIIVDNNSRDNTKLVAAEFCARYPNVRYCCETAQGLAHARNRGLAEAHGLYVAYIDDDCKVPPQWLAVARDIIEQQRPTIFGGPFFAFYNSHKPAWFKDVYGSYELSAEARALLAGEFVFGGNMFFIRDVLAKVGGFHTGYGMVGNTLDYGEEIVPQMAIREQMPEAGIFYDPALFVYHLVRPEKLSIWWSWRESFSRGKTRERMAGRKTGGHATVPAASSLDVLRAVWRIVADIVRGVFVRDRALYPHVQNYWHEHTRRYIARLGQLSARREAAR
jgi:glycosyltransferase involved in cell wall biosynthesis